MMQPSRNGTGAVEFRANLKAMRIRPARESGDKPVFEILLRSEVDPSTIALAAKAGKDLTCLLVPDPELQPDLFVDGAVTLENEAEVDEDLPLNGHDEEPVSLPSKGSRRRGTRSSERVTS